jgi:hypothetical protein
MQNDNVTDAPAPALIKIGKTIYTATPLDMSDTPTISRAWTLVATRGSKQEKSLFEAKRDGSFTLWSAPNGARGRHALGMPKLVEAHFMGELELVTA